MAEYCIRILKAAAQDLERLDKPTGRRIVQRINWLAANVDAIRLEALTGDFAGLYKLRVGDYRIIHHLRSALGRRDHRDPRCWSSSGDLSKAMRQ